MGRFIPAQYRTVPFSVDLDWLFDSYAPDWDRVVLSRDPSLGVGTCGSVTDTLDLLWQPFRAEAQGELATFHSLLGCYNLHRSDHEVADYLFWSNGWGAPHKVFLYALQLIATYWSDAELRGVVTDGSAWRCSGFPEFLRATVSGESAERSALNDDINRRLCKLTMNLRNEQSYPRVHQPRCALDPWSGPRDEYGLNSPCDIGFKPPNLGGFDWTDGEPTPSSAARCFTFLGLNSTGQCVGPGSIAYGGVWSFTWEPYALYWYGVVCDRLLFWARYCLDYAIYRFSRGDFQIFQTYRTSADRLARYALGHVSRVAQLMIHEFGHTFVSDDLHCGDAACCFDLAAKAWACRVNGRLGIPINDFSAFGTNDFPTSGPGTSLSGVAACGTDGGAVRQVNRTCNQVSITPGSQAVFTGSNRSCVFEPRELVMETNAYQRCVTLCRQTAQTSAERAQCEQSCLEPYADDLIAEGPP